MTRPKSVSAAEIPIFLVPQEIARLMRDRGERVYRISVKRTRYHYYNISVRTRSVPRELAPAPDVSCAGPGEEESAA
jgi:hypothetical protein